MIHIRHNDTMHEQQQYHDSLVASVEKNDACAIVDCDDAAAELLVVDVVPELTRTANGIINANKKKPAPCNNRKPRTANVAVNEP
jgi:hypothetical protein